MFGNEERAQSVETALEQFASVMGIENEAPETQLGDFLCNVHHYMERRLTWDASQRQDAWRKATEVYEEERDEELADADG